MVSLGSSHPRRYRCGLPQSDLTKCPTDPGVIALLRLVTLAFYHPLSILLPDPIGEIMPEHGRGSLGFGNDAERQVTLGKAHQGFLDMPSGLVARHHDLEPVDGADKILLTLVITADGHFFRGELIVRALDLAPGARRIFAVGEFAYHLFEGRNRLLGAPLVAVDVRNLVEIGGADEIHRVGCIRRARMQRNIALRGYNRFIVVPGVVIRV